MHIQFWLVSISYTKIDKEIWNSLNVYKKKLEFNNILETQNQKEQEEQDRKHAGWN